jgi:peptidoglycan hydrolase-like protein with peptidoglycan-binding domain
MKLPFVTTALLAALTGSAAAQTPQVRPAQPAQKPVAQTPHAAPKAAATNPKEQAERLALQSDLAWVSLYNGAINGEAGERLTAAVKAFQKDQGAKETGTLSPQERAALALAAKTLQDGVGWRIVNDPASGARIGLPSKLVPTFLSDATGSKWSSTTGSIQIAFARRKETSATTATVADRERKLNARKTDYSAVRPDFFVLSGSQGLKKFYIRGQIRNDEVRVLTILYDQATEGTMIPVTVAMSSAFVPFPAGPQAQTAPPPRKKVEYSTGLVVSADGAIVADRAATDGCMTIAVVGHGNATRIADDPAHDLALLRIYGANGLTPLVLAGSGAVGSPLTITGIADPRDQGGGNAVTQTRVTATPAGGETVLSPEPGPGFSGAAAFDSKGAFAGLVRLKVAMVAGPAGTPLPPLAVLVPADAVRAFLTAKGVTLTTSAPAEAKAAALRLICVRK